MNLMYGLDGTFKILAVYKSVGHSHVPCTCIHGLKFYQEYADSQSTLWSLHMCFAGTVWELIKAHNSWLIPGISLLNFLCLPQRTPQNRATWVVGLPCLFVCHQDCYCFSQCPRHGVFQALLQIKWDPSWNKAAVFHGLPLPVERLPQWLSWGGGVRGKG